jgi:hypothetical protein
MGEKKNMSVFRIEYELLRDMSMWTAFVVSWSHEEAINTLIRRVGPNHRVISSGLASRVDAISDEVRYWIVDKTVGTKTSDEKVGAPITEEKQAVEEKSKKSSLKRK